MKRKEIQDKFCKVDLLPHLITQKNKI